MKIVVFCLLLFIFSTNIALGQNVPDDWTGCSGVDASLCDLSVYDPNNCDPFAGENSARISWNEASCISQEQGCFIRHPDLPLDTAGQERGVCLLPQEQQTYTCANRPTNSCGSEYTLCFDSILDAGVGAGDCGCVERTTNPGGVPVSFCTFLDQDQLDQQQNRRNFTDDNCPVCPAGYSANSVDGTCWRIQGGDISNNVPILSFETCGDNQRCSYTQDGAGCEDLQGGGCSLKSPNDTCGTERPINCETGSEYYCCETLGQCVQAGGEQQLCIQTGDLTPETGPTSCREIYPDTFPQLCRTEDWTGPLGVTLEEAKHCCFSQQACDALGGFDRGAITDRPINNYDICISNLSGNPAALDNCNDCYAEEGIWTAIGCIDQDPRNMTERLISIGIGVLGGIFLLRVLAAAFMLTTSQGDVKKTSEAKEMITEAIVGVLFVLFSVTLLQFVGSDIMQIPGFGS